MTEPMHRIEIYELECMRRKNYFLQDTSFLQTASRFYIGEDIDLLLGGQSVTGEVINYIHSYFRVRNYIEMISVKLDNPCRINKYRITDIDFYRTESRSWIEFFI